MNPAIVALTIFAHLSSFAQEDRNKILLAKDGRKVWIIYGWIGLRTKTDTVKYFGEKDFSYRIHKITKDSLYIEAPAKYHYDLVTNTTDEQRINFKSSRFLKSFRRHKVRYNAYIIVDSLLIKKYSYKDIISIDYPPEGSNDTGCMMCVFVLLIPIANVIIYLKFRERWHPQTYNLQDWKLTVENN